MAAFPLTQAPYWKSSSALLGDGPVVAAGYVQGTTNGSQPTLTNVLQVDATQKFRIGTIARFTDETYGEIEAIYLKGVASLAQYDAVKFDSAQATPVAVTRLINTNAASGAGPVAVALSNPAAGQFGWFAVRGKVPVSSAGAVVNTGFAYGATAGQLAVISTGASPLNGDIIGANAKSAQDGPAAGFTDVELSHPFVYMHS